MSTQQKELLKARKVIEAKLKALYRAMRFTESTIDVLESEIAHTNEALESELRMLDELNDTEHKYNLELEEIALKLNQLSEV